MAKGMFFADGVETQLEVGDRLFFRRSDYSVQVITKKGDDHADNRKKFDRFDDRLAFDSLNLGTTRISLMVWAQMFAKILAIAGVETKKLREEEHYLSLEITAVHQPDAKLVYLQNPGRARAPGGFGLFDFEN